jgi:hypothetical protein
MQWYAYWPFDSVSLLIALDCPLPIDIILVSSDGKRLGGHIQNLATYSDGFTPEVPVETDARASQFGIEAIQYEEDERTLKLLLQFMHRAEPPNLRHLKFKELEKFAYAAHKYRVFAAVGQAHLLMEWVVQVSIILT